MTSEGWRGASEVGTDPSANDKPSMKQTAGPSISLRPAQGDTLGQSLEIHHMALAEVAG